MVYIIPNLFNVLIVWANSKDVFVIFVVSSNYCVS